MFLTYHCDEYFGAGGFCDASRLPKFLSTTSTAERCTYVKRLPHDIAAVIFILVIVRHDEMNVYVEGERALLTRHLDDGILTEIIRAKFSHIIN